jgi:NAD(P)-dependent dehydrogenase (short-subunit alcohol dehydrogenase family)
MVSHWGFGHRSDAVTTPKPEVAIMDLQLTNKKALVTGSTAGIGFAVACLPTREGASVVVNGRSQKPVDEAVRRIPKGQSGVQVTGVAANLGPKEGVDQLTENLPAVGSQEPGACFRSGARSARRTRASAQSGQMSSAWRARCTRVGS